MQQKILVRMSPTLCPGVKDPSNISTQIRVHSLKKYQKKKKTLIILLPIHLWSV